MSSLSLTSSLPSPLTPQQFLISSLTTISTVYFNSPSLPPTPTPHLHHHQLHHFTMCDYLNYLHHNHHHFLHPSPSLLPFHSSALSTQFPPSPLHQPHISTLSSTNHPNISSFISSLHQPFSHLLHLYHHLNQTQYTILHLYHRFSNSTISSSISSTAIITSVLWVSSSSD